MVMVEGVSPAGIESGSSETSGGEGGGDGGAGGGNGTGARGDGSAGGEEPHLTSHASIELTPQGALAYI